MGTEVSKPIFWLSPVHYFCTSDTLSLFTSLSLEISKLPYLIIIQFGLLVTGCFLWKLLLTGSKVEGKPHKDDSNHFHITYRVHHDWSVPIIMEEATPLTAPAESGKDYSIGGRALVMKTVSFNVQHPLHRSPEGQVDVLACFQLVGVIHLIHRLKCIHITSTH